MFPSALPVARVSAVMSRILSVVVLLAVGTAVASADDEPLAPSKFDARFAAPEFASDARPAWVRSLENINKNGLPIMRLRRNAHSDLVLGIRGDGYLSIYLAAPRGR